MTPLEKVKEILYESREPDFEKIKDILIEMQSEHLSALGYYDVLMNIKQDKKYTGVEKMNFLLWLYNNAVELDNIYSMFHSKPEYSSHSQPSVGHVYSMLSKEIIKVYNRISNAKTKYKNYEFSLNIEFKAIKKTK